MFPGMGRGNFDPNIFKSGIERFRRHLVHAVDRAAQTVSGVLQRRPRASGLDDATWWPSRYLLHVEGPQQQHIPKRMFGLATGRGWRRLMRRSAGYNEASSALEQVRGTKSASRSSWRRPRRPRPSSRSSGWRVPLDDLKTGRFDASTHAPAARGMTAGAAIALRERPRQLQGQVARSRLRRQRQTDRRSALNATETSPRLDAGTRHRRDRERARGAALAQRGNRSAAFTIRRKPSGPRRPT